MRKLPPPILDVMLNGRHIGQVPFLMKTKQTVIDGERIEFFDYEELSEYIESLCPDVRGEDFRIFETTNVI